MVELSSNSVRPPSQAPFVQPRDMTSSDIVDI
jgi:hypothetical protein